MKFYIFARLFCRSLMTPIYPCEMDTLKQFNPHFQLSQESLLKVFSFLVSYTIATDASSAGQRSPRTFTDPNWPQMWHLNRGPGLDMGISEAWNEGMTGKGVVVSILGYGLEINHPDIIQNYDPQASFDYINNYEDPTDHYDDSSNSRGTRCAGLVAGQANNSYCGVGIAYEASIGGIMFLGYDKNYDLVMARSLSHNNQHIDIYSMSWGPDDGSTVDGPGRLALAAIINGVTKGRHGLGSIFIFASGVGGREHDNCDSYVNSMYTIAVNSATGEGEVPSYAEAYSSILAATYSSGFINGIERKITTTDIRGSCTSEFSGTAVAAPMASGIVALALQANPTLTWRDVQQLIIQTAQHTQLNVSDWTTNGVGRQFSHYFGYGLMDAGAMVKMARKWIRLPPRMECRVSIDLKSDLETLHYEIPPNWNISVSFKIKVETCPDITYLEHVQVRLKIAVDTSRGDIRVAIKSALGTWSTLLTPNPYDREGSLSVIDCPFTTVHFWGENPRGEWELEIQNGGLSYEGLSNPTIFLYGTATDPNNVGNGSVIYSNPTGTDNYPEIPKFLDHLDNSDSNHEMIGETTPSHSYWSLGVAGFGVIMVVSVFLMLYKFVKSRRNVNSFND